VSEQNGNKGTLEAELDREVIRCKVCGLVQYRTRVGNCRRCLRLLPPRLEYLIPPPEPQELPGDDRQLFEKWPNRETVENIGQRIESGQMTPSLGTLEKISEALGVGLSRFFIPESNGEALLEDPFIQGLRPFLRQLDWEQWQSILKRLQAIGDHVSSGTAQLRTMPQPRPAQTANTAFRRAVPPAAANHR